jgi:hypothetical protein
MEFTICKGRRPAAVAISKGPTSSAVSPARGKEKTNKKDRADRKAEARRAGVRIQDVRMQSHAKTRRRLAGVADPSAVGPSIDGH